MENGHAPAAPPSAEYNPPFGPEEVRTAPAGDRRQLAAAAAGEQALLRLPALARHCCTCSPMPTAPFYSGARWATPWWTSSPTTRRASSRCPSAAKCSLATSGERRASAGCSTSDRLTSRHQCVTPAGYTAALRRAEQLLSSPVCCALLSPASQPTPGCQTRLCRPCLPDQAPEQPESIEQILADVSQHIMPGMTHWQSPRFFGWFRWEVC